MHRPARYQIQRGPSGFDSIEPDYDYEEPDRDAPDPETEPEEPEP
jgi:hypothetical protein